MYKCYDSVEHNTLISLPLVASCSKNISPFYPTSNSDWSPISSRTLSCMLLTHASFLLQILIRTDILHLCKLLGLPVIPKSALTTLTVARDDANRLPLAVSLVVTLHLKSLRSGRLSEIKRCGSWNYFKFHSVWVQI